MWTDFNRGDRRAMETARAEINDFRLIRNPEGTVFRPVDAVALHMNFVTKLLDWFGQDLSGPRVVISHNAPVVNPNTKFRGSPLMPAFNSLLSITCFQSLDMIEVIEKHQPALWVHGHNHECDDQTVGRARIISNQLGYPDGRSSSARADEARGQFFVPDDHLAGTHDGAQPKLTHLISYLPQKACENFSRGVILRKWRIT
jgi:hypothetical protein